MEQGIEFVIKPIETEHYDAIMEIHEAILKRFTKPQWKSPVKNRMGQKDVIGFVAFHQGKVVGFILSEIKKGDFGLDQSGWLQIVGVHPKFMGRGIGKALGKHLLEHYRAMGIRDIYTTVRWDAVDMLSFFKSLGFDRSNFINLRHRYKD
jgi:ribosomal protein S18 acetylase RimI-like enzyme